MSRHILSLLSEVTWVLPALLLAWVAQFSHLVAAVSTRPRLIPPNRQREATMKPATGLLRLSLVMCNQLANSNGERQRMSTTPCHLYAQWRSLSANLVSERLVTSDSM